MATAKRKCTLPGQYLEAHNWAQADRCFDETDEEGNLTLANQIAEVVGGNEAQSPCGFFMHLLADAQRELRNALRMVPGSSKGLSLTEVELDDLRETIEAVQRRLALANYLGGNAIEAHIVEPENDKEPV